MLNVRYVSHGSASVNISCVQADNLVTISMPQCFLHSNAVNDSHREMMGEEMASF